MFFGFFPRTAAAALVLALYWGATLLYLPATILTILRSASGCPSRLP